MVRKKPKIPQLHQLPQTQKSGNWFDRIASPYLQEYEKLSEEDKNKLLSYSNQTTKRNTGIGSFDPQAINSINSLVKGLLGVEPTTGRNSGGGSFDPETVKMQNAQNSWFKAGGLSDGYELGDLTLSNWASTGDFLRHVGKGAFGVAEGVVDTVLYGMSEASGLAGDAASYFGLGKVEDVARFTDQKMKELAMEDSATKAFGGTGDWLDEMSYLGGKTDSVAEGVGQVATTALLAKFGGANGVNPTLLTSGTMFASSLGRGITEALNSGASDEEAWLYGLISGTADAATEMLFGGIGKGINALGFSRGITSLDDIVAKNITGKISNTLMKNIAQAGIKGSFEGLEEVLAGFAQAWGKSVTYLKDEVDSGKLDFWDIVKDENLFEQWITGALTSAISSAPSVSQATVKGQEYITGYTKQDQEVVNVLVDEMIAEKEAAGETLTAKDKSNIRAEVEEKLENGFIPTEKIEQILGGEKLTEYQNVTEQENKAIAELAELYEGEELQNKVAQFLEGSKRTEAANALSEYVYDLVKDSKVAESYRESARRTQQFTADLNQYKDENQRAIVQKAVESGVLNNTNRTHDMVNWVSKMASRLGTDVDFTNNAKLKESIFGVDGKTVDGYVTKDGITINVNSPRYINTVVGHEITHVLEGSQLYDALEAAVLEYAKEKGTYKDVMKAAFDMYSGVEGYTGADGQLKIKKEAVANMVGDYLFTDQAFVNRLAAKNPNIFQKMWNEIKYMVKQAAAGSNEKKKLLEVQRAFEKAFENARKSGTDTQQTVTAEETAEQNKLKEIDLDYDTQSETVYSLSSLEDAFSYNESEADYQAARLEYETALAKSIAVDKDNVTREEMDKARRYLDSLFLIHDMIAMERDRLDYEAAVGKSAWVSNAEYGGSIDFSTLCAKRRLFTGTFDAIQNQLPDMVLDENDFLQIRQLLLEKELESPCSMCYVEGSRAKHGVYVAKFLKEYKQTNPAWMPQIADFTSTTRLEQTRINHPEAYKAYTEAMNKLAQRKPKEASVRTDYRGEILRDFKDTSTVAEKNKNGGVRFNSFSDFEIIHAIDCMQVLTDMARVGLNGQSYTKVREFAEAFGNTGLKINLSLVAKGVDANGNLLFDEINGMKYDEAMDLRNRYSKNVGTVVVVFDQAQLEAALANDTVDFVLPFHRSQWRKSQYTMMGLPTSTKDFTNFQNDRIKNPSTGRPVKLSKIKHTSQYTNDITGESFDITGNIMPNQYWDFNQDGRANAQRYLDYINENGMTPKFEFVLTKQDGKWVLPEGAVGDGYFKLLIDFKMYDNDGVGSPQTAVVPDFNMPYIQRMLENYKGGHQAFPVAHDVVEEFVQGKKSGKYSLSDENTVPGNYGNYRVSGEEIALEDDLLPMAQTNAQTKVAEPETEELPMGQEAILERFQSSRPDKAENLQTLIEQDRRYVETISEEIAEKEAQLEAMEHPYSKAAKELRSQIEQLQRKLTNVENNLSKRQEALTQTQMEAEQSAVAEEVAEEAAVAEEGKATPTGGSRFTNPETNPYLKKLYDDRKKAEEDLDNFRTLMEKTLAVEDIAIRELENQYRTISDKNSKQADAIRQKIYEKTEHRKNLEEGLTQTETHLQEKIDKLNDTRKERSAVKLMRNEETNAMFRNIIGSTLFWKDLPTGLSYKTKTLRRILREVVRSKDGKPDYKTADQLYDILETTYDRNEAALKRESKELKEPFAELKLNKWEDEYAHMVAERRYNPKSEAMPEAYYQKYGDKIDVQKVEKSVELARDLYENFFQRINKVLRENGMPEVPYRKGYFPHFMIPKQNGLMKALGWKPINAEIPTSLAGITESFTPGKSWQSFDMAREGDLTDYSLLKGLDMYIHGALDWIYHIEDIHRFRRLENFIRTEHADNNLKMRIEAIIADETLDAEQTLDRIEEETKKQEMKLGGLVRELRNRANNLANKKAAGDRKMEDDFSRKAYSVMNNVNSRVNANMVVGSLRSAMTNFIPLVQSWHEVNPVYTALGMMETVKGKLVGDDIIEKSTFLTNRLMDEENLYKGFWDKVTDVVAWFGNRVDSITSQTVWRSKYLQNLKSGMSEDAAIADADQFAKNLMAGRSRGNAPTIFNEKNPITKLFTAFQLEVANQYGYMFKDVIQDAKIKAGQTDSKAQKAKIYGKLVSGYAEAFIGAYLFNSLFSMITGSTAAFDPIRIIQELLGDMGVGDDDEEPEEWDQILLKFGENVLQEVPFVGGLLGGGRTPISNILPYSGTDNPFATMLKQVKEGKFEDMADELFNPLWYLALPVGGGQLRKTAKGLSMFLDDDLPISGSYTDSGNLRFPVEETPWNVVQAGLFGQYANSNARDYFDQGRSALNPNQQREFAALGVDIQDYWDFQDREKKIADTVEAGNAPDMVIIMNKYLNSVRSEMSALLKEEEELLDDATLNGYDKERRLKKIREEYNALAKARYNDYGNVTFDGDYASVGGQYYQWYTPKDGDPEWRKMSDDQVDQYLTTKDAGDAYYATNGKTHYRRNDDDEWVKITQDQLKKQKKVTHELGISAEDYWSNKEEYDFAYEYPERYSVAKMVGGYQNYKAYSNELNSIKSDYDQNGKSISGSRKAKVYDYIWNLDIPEMQKMILFKSEYTADDTYNVSIIKYINGRRDMSKQEKISVLKKLGFDVDKNGKISW